MLAAPSQDWNVFQQLFVEHWDGFKRVYPRYHTPYYDDLVDKMLRCGTPDKIGYIAYRCLHCGQGKHLVAMSGKSSLCLRCAQVYVDNWVSQVSRIWKPIRAFQADRGPASSSSPSFPGDISWSWESRSAAAPSPARDATG